jgi:hypothetical protein
MRLSAAGCCIDSIQSHVLEPAEPLAWVITRETNLKYLKGMVPRVQSEFAELALTTLRSILRETLRAESVMGEADLDSDIVISAQ